ncbi:MAG: alpha/beta fold hydrolase [Rhodobacterales bacterium]|nr:alpha/beta fold hydrolase [Rhodobacterales bacterium]
MQRIAASLFVLLALMSCAQRGTLTIAADPMGVGSSETIFVATSRGIDPETQTLGGERAVNESFAVFNVSIPPNREEGEINWPPRGEVADPATDFVTTRAETLPDTASFRRELREQIAAAPEADGGVVIFIHGFNTNFSEGLYRLAQIKHDLDVDGVVVHYSWPSKASPFGYLYDHDSANFARDGLEELIRLVHKAGAKRITLFAHSMGSYLTMETLRQMAIRDGNVNLVDVVILMSPDIDVDLFKSQAAAIGRLPQPFLIFTSDKDRALGLSSRLSGDGTRLGNLQDPAELGDLKVTLVEVGAYSTGSGHSTPVSSPELIALLDKINDVDGFLHTDELSRVGLLEGAVLSVQNATQIIVEPMEEAAQ